MVNLYIAETEFENNYPRVYHFAVCDTYLIAWRLDEQLDRALEQVASHTCMQTIVSGPNPVKISAKATARVGK